MNLNIVDFTVEKSDILYDYLPDNIDSYEDMLKDKRYLLITFYVTDDLGKISPKDFADLEKYWKEYKGTLGEDVGSIKFIQIKNALSINKVRHVLRTLGFGHTYTRKEDINKIKKNNIISSLYLDWSTSEGLGFIYNHF